MRRPTFLVLAVLLAIAAIAAPALADDGYGDPKKAFICHFEDHTAPAPFTARDIYGDTYTVDGDYVIKYTNMLNNPAHPINYCINVAGGDAVLRVSVNSLRGHGTQLLTQLDGYPNGFKGF